MSTSNNPTDKEYKNWEEIKEDNYWHKIFDRDPQDLLDSLLCEKSEEFIYPGDEDIIRKHNKNLIEKGKGDNVFRTSLLPKPYRGNLKDPKLVILSLNPGYKERTKKTLFTLLRPECQKRFIKITKENALLEARYIISQAQEDAVDDVMDNGYWSGQLANLNDDGADLSKIGLIQFIPYASKHFDSWGDEVLESQKISVDIIRRLLYMDESTLFLVMRSREQWKKLIGNEMNDEKYKSRFLYSKNPRCQKISPKNLQEGQYDYIKKALKN